MKTYRTLQEMKEDEALAAEVLAFQVSLTEPYNLKGVFESDFGGDVFIVETLEDLDQISTMVEDLNLSSNRWLSIRETTSSFDQAAYLHGRTWAIIWMATNNNGGPAYFVPKAIVDQCPNIEASMKLSSKDGQIEELNESNRYED